jgi:hypothetical protein
MSVQISHETEARLAEEAKRLGVSVDALLQRLLSEPGVSAGPAPKLPALHLGAMGPLHRRDIYDDAD